MAVINPPLYDNPFNLEHHAAGMPPRRIYQTVFNINQGRHNTGSLDKSIRTVNLAPGIHAINPTSKWYVPYNDIKAAQFEYANHVRTSQIHDEKHDTDIGERVRGYNDQGQRVTGFLIPSLLRQKLMAKYSNGDPVSTYHDDVRVPATAPSSPESHNRVTRAQAHVNNPFLRSRNVAPPVQAVPAQAAPAQAAAVQVPLPNPPPQPHPYVPAPIQRNRRVNAGVPATRWTYPAQARRHGHGVILGNGVIVGRGLLLGGRNYHPIGSNQLYVDKDHDIHFGRKRKTLTSETYKDDDRNETRAKKLSRFHVDDRIKSFYAINPRSANAQML